MLLKFDVVRKGRNVDIVPAYPDVISSSDVHVSAESPEHFYR